jgi:uncharacterized OsmC-like protein
MTSTMRTGAINATLASWKQNPEQARATPVVVARAAGAHTVLEAGSFAWPVDLPMMLGGANSAPSPTAMLLGALAGCAVLFIRDTLAPALETAVTAVRATARCRADFRGLLAVDGAVPDLEDLEIDIDIDTPDGEDAAQRLFCAWLARCPVYLALVKPTEVKARLAVHRAIGPGA